MQMVAWSSDLQRAVRMAKQNEGLLNSKEFMKSLGLTSSEESTLVSVFKKKISDSKQKAWI
ncbi:hypothetical protein [Gorillibacterium sp. sgz5001074]|uniref:hypothetical protein n=1 Tax=Gorillibacterium sp. sgz5001074 TaxID=3446695 RepID=UPI003F66AAB8